MTPSVEAELNKIGWELVKRVAPILADQLKLVFDTSRPFVATDSQARSEAKELERIGKAVVVVLSGLRSLSESVRRNISLSALSREEALQMTRSGAELTDLPGKVESSLWKLLAGLEATEARLNSEGGPSRRGSPKNLYPHAVAYAAAQIYVIGRGEMPVAHNKTAGQETRGYFGMSLEKLFDAMGLGFDTIGPARAAVEKIESLNDEDWFSLMAIRCPLTRHMVRLELRQVF